MRAALSLLSMLAATPVLAQAGGEATPFHVGKIELVALKDNVFPAPNDGKTFGVDVGPAAVTKLLESKGLPGDKITVGVDALLVRTGGRILLLDTGYGAKNGGTLIASLARAGVQPGDVTDILLTHSHGDHVAGMVTTDGKLAFPNATVRMAKAEWAWMQAQDGAKPIAAVVAPRVQTFTPGDTIAPGVVSIAIPGHTPGHVGYEIRSGKARLLDIGDTAHSSVVSLAEPGWVMGFDSDKPVGTATRIATLKRLAASGEFVFAPHFPYPGVGKIVTDGMGFAWKAELPK